jgi:hypothetical protein
MTDGDLVFVLFVFWGVIFAWMCHADWGLLFFFGCYSQDRQFDSMKAKAS